MAKTKVSEFDAVASNNTDINSVNVAEGCPPSGINNAIREMASLLKKQEVGTDAMTSPDIDGGTIDGATIGGSSGVTIGVSDGTVSAPSIKFTSDTNTGIYRGGTDILKFVTAGTDAITIDASQDVTLASGLTVSYDRSGTSGGFILYDDNQSENRLSLQTGGGTGVNAVINQSGGSLNITNDSLENIASFSDSGDISFYEDTGTTPKFFWDSSEERLGIGTASPITNLDVRDTGANNGGTLTLGTTNDTTGGDYGAIQFYKADASGAGAGVTASITATDGASSGANSELVFATGDSSSANTEAMRIDSSQNLLVGTTDTAPYSNSSGTDADNGFAITETAFSVAGYKPTANTSFIGSMNRTASDGAILQFRKDGTTVGSIGTQGGTLEIGSGDVYLQFNGTNDWIKPMDGSGNNKPNVDLGTSGAKFKDLYLSGTIEIEQGTGNVAVGKDALSVNTGSNNTAVGYQALTANNTGVNNIAMGSGTLDVNSTGSRNTAIGTFAMESNITASYNTALGYGAGLSYNSTFGSNTYVGYQAGYSSTGDSNTFVGARVISTGKGCGQDMTTGSYNTILGAFSGNQGGLDIRTSSNNIVLSDGAGNPRLFYNNVTWYNETSYVGSDVGGFGASVSRVHLTGNLASGGVGVCVLSNRNTSTGGDPSPSLVLNKGSSTTSSNQRFIQFYANATTTTSTAMGAIVGNGANNAQFATLSDIREKENITQINGSLNKINNLNPVEFDWINSDEHCNAGFIAQEVQEIFPDFVIQNVSNDGEEERLGLTGGMTGGFVAHLVKAIQELSAKNEALEARLSALENG